MKLQCDITLPASKSESNRALMIAAYGEFEPVFQNLSDSKDTLVIKKTLSRLPFMSFLYGFVRWRESINNKPSTLPTAARHRVS